jgi:hypothetical protein
VVVPLLLQRVNGSQWDYRSAGQDWAGTDAAGQPWVCLTGRSQSPVQVDPTAATALHPAQQVDWSGLGAVPSSGSNVQLTNNGHTIMVTISATAAAPAPALRLPLPGEQPLCLRSRKCQQAVVTAWQQPHIQNGSVPHDRRVLRGPALRCTSAELHMVIQCGFC